MYRGVSWGALGPLPPGSEKGHQKKKKLKGKGKEKRGKKREKRKEKKEKDKSTNMTNRVPFKHK